MSTKETGWPAFPLPLGNESIDHSVAGMDLRQYAAIKLKVPDSGEDWLDAMILAALRNDFAGKAMAAIMLEVNGLGDDRPGSPRWESAQVADLAYEHADSMLEARK